HGSNRHRSSFKSKIATARRRAKGQTSARCGEQVRRSITSLGEQAEPREADKPRHKRSKLVLQLGSTSQSDLAGDVTYGEGLGGATTLDNVPSKSAILNGLQRRGRSSYSRGSAAAL